MILPADRLSLRPERPVWAVLGLLLACVAAPVRAQAPSCSWGDGVVLRAGAHQPVLIADDGAAGVVAVTYFEPGWYGPTNDLRFFHVLEQGRMDPSLPAAGVPFISSADLPSEAGVSAVRVVSDGAGGAYVLFFACGQYLAHLTCNGVGEVRLMHVTGQGTTAPGWPAAGLPLVGGIGDFPLDHVDIVSDGASGVIAAWIDAADPNSAAPLIRAQRFAPDGSTQWPGGGSGLVVLDAQTMRVSLRLGSDHAGGCTIVTSEEISGKFEQYMLRAGRVDASGGLPWTTAGRLVITQPTYTTVAMSVSIDAQGRSFIIAYLHDPPNTVQDCYTQLLSPQGTRLWGQFGVFVGQTTNRVFLPTGLVTPSGYLSVHGDVGGAYRLQLQDENGFSGWDPLDYGLAADWTLPSAPQLPLAAPDGHVLSVWKSQGAVATWDVRAMELDESGNIVPGWPVDGVHVCGSQPYHDLADAIVSRGQLFVALAGPGLPEGPKIQRLSRAVLSVPADLPASPLELAPPVPNPARGAWLVRLALRSDAAVSLEAFDVAGRRALAAGLGPLTAGRHVLEVPGGASLAPGVYRVRARAGAHTAERTLVKVR